MSPGRHGRSPPSPSPTGQPSRSAVATAAATDSGLALAQRLGDDVVAVVDVGAEHVHRAVVAAAGPAGVERAVRRLDAGLGLDDVGEHAVDPVDDGDVERKLADSTSRSAPIWSAAAR